MKRYRFLLLAFFLANNTFANINSTPDLSSEKNIPHNILEVASAVYEKYQD